MARRLATLRLRTRIALCLALVSVPVAIAAGYAIARDSRSDERLCTLIAGMSGVRVNVVVPGLREQVERYVAVARKRHHTVKGVVRAVRHHLRGRLGSVVICVDGRCVRRPLRTSTLYGAPAATGPRRVRVSVAVVRPGAPWQVAHATVRLQRDEPNGPGCGTWWNAAVQMRDSRLTAISGSSS